MIKQEEFIRQYAEFNGISLLAAETEIRRFKKTFKYLTMANEGICLKGFIESIVKYQKPCQRQDPRNLEKVDVPERYIISVKARPTFRKLYEKMFEEGEDENDN